MTPSAHPGWRQTRPDALTRELRLRDFDAAMAFVNQLAAGAEDHLRRPDMCITEFNHVQITVANLHHAGPHAGRVPPAGEGQRGHRRRSGRGSGLAAQLAAR